MIAALPFVPEDVLPTAWSNLKSLLPADMSTFVDEYTWIVSSHREPNFGQKLLMSITEKIVAGLASSPGFKIFSCPFKCMNFLE